MSHLWGVYQGLAAQEENYYYLWNSIAEANPKFDDLVQYYLNEHSNQLEETINLLFKSICFSSEVFLLGLICRYRKDYA